MGVLWTFHTLLSRRLYSRPLLPPRQRQLPNCAQLLRARRRLLSRRYFNKDVFHSVSFLQFPLDVNRSCRYDRTSHNVEWHFLPLLVRPQASCLSILRGTDLAELFRVIEAPFLVFAPVSRPCAADLQNSPALLNFLVQGNWGVVGN